MEQTMSSVATLTPPTSRFAPTCKLHYLSGFNDVDAVFVGCVSGEFQICNRNLDHGKRHIIQSGDVFVYQQGLDTVESDGVEWTLLDNDDLFTIWRPLSPLQLTKKQAQVTYNGVISVIIAYDSAWKSVDRILVQPSHLPFSPGRSSQMGCYEQYNASLFTLMERLQSDIKAWGTNLPYFFQTLRAMVFRFISEHHHYAFTNRLNQDFFLVLPFAQAFWQNLQKSPLLKDKTAVQIKQQTQALLSAVVSMVSCGHIQRHYPLDDKFLPQQNSYLILRGLGFDVYPIFDKWNSVAAKDTHLIWLPQGLPCPERFLQDMCAHWQERLPILRPQSSLHHPSGFSDARAYLSSDQQDRVLISIEFLLDKLPVFRNPTHIRRLFLVHYACEIDPHEAGKSLCNTLKDWTSKDGDGFRDELLLSFRDPQCKPAEMALVLAALWTLSKLECFHGHLMRKYIAPSVSDFEMWLRYPDDMEYGFDVIDALFCSFASAMSSGQVNKDLAETIWVFLEDVRTVKFPPVSPIDYMQIWEDRLDGSSLDEILVCDGEGALQVQGESASSGVRNPLGANQFQHAPRVLIAEEERRKVADEELKLDCDADLDGMSETTDIEDELCQLSLAELTGQ